MTTVRWPLPGRIGFRLAFCYFGLYILCNGNVTLITPIDRTFWLGGIVSTWLFEPFALLAAKLGTTLFHLKGMATIWHGGGSGDTALNWIVIGITLLVAIVAALIWSVADRKRESYPLLYAWLRFTVRLMLGVSMILYGLAKFFPLQMPAITMGNLNEPLGQMSPFSLLWALLGFAPKYEMICGAAELAAGVLLLIRKTALAGALLTAFVMTNVLLYNLFFDVPVKLFAAHLVLMAVFLIIPDCKPLFSFFVMNKEAGPRGVWVPPASRTKFKRATIIVEVCYLVLALFTIGKSVITTWQRHVASLAPSPLVGSWSIKSAGPTPMTTPDGGTWTTIYFDDTMRAMVRDTNGQLWRYYLKYDAVKKTIEMRNMIDYTLFSWKVDDPNHLTLSAINAGFNPLRVPNKNPQAVKLVAPNRAESLELERQPVPKSYPLYDRGFHLVSEWGYER
jgi:hypothetical protein